MAEQTHEGQPFRRGPRQRNHGQANSRPWEFAGRLRPSRHQPMRVLTCSAHTGGAHPLVHRRGPGRESTVRWAWSVELSAPSLTVKSRRRPEPAGLKITVEDWARWWSAAEHRLGLEDLDVRGHPLSILPRSASGRKSAAARMLCGRPGIWCDPRAGPRSRCSCLAGSARSAGVDQPSRLGVQLGRSPFDESRSRVALHRSSTALLPPAWKSLRSAKSRARS